MRNRLAWLLAGLGLVALVRYLRREPAPMLEPPAPAAVDPRADELRQRLAAAKEVVDERDAFEEAETPVDAAPDPDVRRRDVHLRGRAAVERMQRDG